MNSQWGIADSVRPEMLKMGRVLRAKTQHELAIEAEIDQGLISKYENGRPIPKEDLKSIADALQLPIAFFRRHIILHAPNGASMIMFRRRQTVSMRHQEQVIMEMNRIRDNVSTLLESVDLEVIARLPLHEPKEDTTEEIESIAERVRLELRIPPGPIQSMMRVMESIGSVIIRRQLPARIDALVDYLPGKTPIILLNEELLGGRQRFTLAHELGHLIMHNSIVSNYEVIESQADAFASALLMPSVEIRSQMRNLTMERLIGLSAQWRVSVQALVRRAKNLDAITERQYRYWNEQFGIGGFRATEPTPISIEMPQLLTSLVRLHLNDLRYSVNELSEALSMQEWEFRRNYLGENLQLVKSKKRTTLRTFGDGTN